MTAYSLILAAATGMFSVPPSAAQQLDRRSRDEPEIVVEAGGRVGPCDVLRFTQDGRFLLAGGDDKVVRVWPHSASGLETDRSKVQTLRWRAWREQRGGIKAIAISPDGKRVVVGGYGMKPSTVAILDRETGDTVAITWPVTREGDPNFGTVRAVAFGSEGRVGFGTSDGSLWLWDSTRLDAPDADGRTAAPPVRVGKHYNLADPDAKRDFNFPRLVYFLDKSKLVSVAQSGQVVECDLTGKVADTPTKPPLAKHLFYTHDGQPLDPVYRAELIDGGKWLLLANDGPRVLLRSVDGKQAISLPLGDEQFPRSVAFHPKTQQLAVGVATVLTAGKDGRRFFSEGNDEIWLYDDPIKNPKGKPTVIRHTGRAEALAFHPAEQQLAVAGGDADEVKLLALAKPEAPLTVVRGAGRRPWAVNLSANGKLVGVRVGRDATSTDPNARAAGPWTRFDLTRLKPSLDDSQEWVNPVSESDGWRVVPDAKDRFVWHAERKADGKQFRLALDRNRDLAPTCYTFLPAKDAHPTRVIVGHYYGCTLFELVPERARNGAFAGSKVFTGHAGEVTSVVAAKDQSWFVTGGTDHTVAAWSLVDWKSERILGATFVLQDAGVAVRAVDPGSPAWEAGLRAGDVLDKLLVNANLVYDRREGKPAFGTANDALAELKSPRPRIELYFGIAATATAKRYETLTTVRQRPLWKWFPAFDRHDRLNDWVVWMWNGSYYHTKTANGDRLAGWHVNHPEPGGRPEFYQLQQFEKQFHLPEVIEKLTESRDAGKALVLACGENPAQVSFTKYEPAPLRLKLEQLDVKDDGVPLTITARPRGNNPDLLPERVELWVNDHLVETWPSPGKKLDPKREFNAPYTIPASKFRAGENQIAVLAFNAAGGRVEDSHFVRNARPPGDANLLALLTGINDYSDTRKNAAGARKFGDLSSAKDDATALGKGFEKFAGPDFFFKAAKLDVQLDADAVRAKLTANLAALAKRAKPDDTLIVFFAGHGDLLTPDDVLPKGGRSVLAGEGTFLLCCPNYSPKEPGDTALSADELFEALAKINCRKVVLLDACHSGRATSANLLRRCVPNGQGPVVIASCDEGEQSFEHAKFGHGLFTYAILDALDKDKGFRKADFDSDGALSPEELFDHIAAKVPELMKQAGLKETQTPICFPRQLPKHALLKR